MAALGAIGAVGTVGCCATSLACCACRCLADATCSLCGKVFPVSFSRIVYVAIFLITSVVAWAVGTYVDVEYFDKLATFRQCEGAGRACYLNLLVTRIMFSLAVVHAIMALLTIGVARKDDCRAGLHDGWWAPKLLLLAGLAVASMWIGNGFFIVWGWISLIGAALFIFVQIVMLIDFACDWAHKWIENAEEAQTAAGDEEGSCNRWVGLLLFCTFGMYAISLAMLIVQYIFFTKPVVEGGCRQKSLNTFFITFNLILALIASLISLLPKVREKKPDSGILQSSVLCLYTTYLVFSSLVSEPSDWMSGCNNYFTPATSTNSTTGQRIVIIIGAIITIIAVCYSTIRTSSSGSKLAIWGGQKGEDAKLAEDEAVPYNFSLFHVAFFLGAMYVEQLLTNWQTIEKPNTMSSGSPNEISVDSGVAAVWIKIVSGWLVYILYIWSLIAPLLFPDRDFSGA